MKTRHFRDLQVWQKAMDLAAIIYSVSDRFPKTEVFGLTAQMRRSAVSIPCNVAEGHGRLSDPGLAVFLGHARGSLFELETQMELAIRFEYVGHEVGNDIVTQINELARMLNAFLAPLQHPERFEMKRPPFNSPQ